MSLRELFTQARNHSPIEIYLSANSVYRCWVPCRMQPVHEAREKYVSQCDRYIVDSSFNRPEITNQDVLAKGHELQANSVLLEDVYQDYENTVTKLLAGKELVDDHAFTGRVIYPLQAPYVECWHAIGEPEHIAIGGLKNASDETRLRAANALREAGHTGTIHGLGWGVSDDLARAIRENPTLIDSVDSRTPHTQAMEHDYWPGTDVSSVMTIHTAGYLLEQYRKCGLADDPIAVTTLGDFQ